MRPRSALVLCTGRVVVMSRALRVLVAMLARSMRTLRVESLHCVLMARHQDTDLQVREVVEVNSGRRTEGWRDSERPGSGGWFWLVGEACGSDLMPFLIVFDLPFDGDCHDGRLAPDGRPLGN